MNVVMIIQARMSSTRLPGKILKKVLDKTLLEYQIERVSRCQLVDRIVIATTVNPRDQSIIDLCEKLNISYFQGSELDVLDRYYHTAKLYSAEVIVRITSDCPLIDPEIIDQIIQFYLTFYPQYDYVSNCLQRTYPRGMDTEVFSFSALEKAFLKGQQLHEREHVTPFIYNPQNNYKIQNIAYTENQSHYRWTVDTIEDFTLIEKMIISFYPSYPNFTLKDCLNLLQKYPEWSKINSHIAQKSL